MMTSPVPRHASLNDNDKQIIWNIFKFLDDILLHDNKYKRYFGAAPATLDAAKQDAIDYHLQHLATMNIAASSVDAYKVASWYGFYVSKHADDRYKVSLLATIHVLRWFLKQETAVVLDKTTASMLYLLAVNDGVNDEFGIGKNGLYMAFSTARAALNEARRLTPFAPDRLKAPPAK